jgi:hypothetical protein
LDDIVREQPHRRRHDPSRVDAEVAVRRHGQFFTGTGAPTLSQQSASFLGPAGVGAMVSSTCQTFINESYARVATGQMKIGGAYYDESWAVMSLLMMTSNYLGYASIQPVH